MADYLFLYSISPVQDFISQARKTQDLFSGSTLISTLIRHQLNGLLDDTRIKPIVPSASSKSIPNRFVVKICNATESDILVYAESLKTSFVERLKTLISDTFTERLTKHQSDQVFSAFTTNWSAVEIKHSYQQAYQELERIHAGGKSVRSFQQLGNGEGEQGRKCSLCGERNAIVYNTSNKKMHHRLSNNSIGIDSNKLKFNEALCAVCAIKRFSCKSSFPSTSEICLKKTVPQNELTLLKKLGVDPQILYGDVQIDTYLRSEQINVSSTDIRSLKDQIKERCSLKEADLPKYYGLIMFDGDRMGRLLSGDDILETDELEEFQSILAEALGANSRKATDIINDVGQTVYSGGDDFLGFCSLPELLPALKKLHQAFKTEVTDVLSPYLKNSLEVTMSAGVVIAHYKTPLNMVLNWARNMEYEAKTEGNRNAVSLAVLKHSGDIVKTLWNWDQDSSLIDTVQGVIDTITSHDFSTNFIYTLETEFAPLSYKENQTYDKQFQIELSRLIHRSYLENPSAPERNDKEKHLEKNILELYNKSHTQPKVFFSLMRIIAFLCRQQGGE